MPFIDINTIPANEVVPGCRMRTPYGKNLMLSYLEMDEGAVVPLHDHIVKLSGYHVGVWGMSFAVARVATRIRAQDYKVVAGSRLCLTPPT